MVGVRYCNAVLVDRPCALRGVVDCRRRVGDVDVRARGNDAQGINERGAAGTAGTGEDPVDYASGIVSAGRVFPPTGLISRTRLSPESAT